MRASAITALVIALAAAGCASSNCALVRPGGEPIVELGYISAGAAPTATVLRLLPGTARTPDHLVLELEPVGRRRSCRPMHGAAVRQLRASLVAPAFRQVLDAEAAFGNDLGVHEAVLSIRSAALQVQRRPSVISPPLQRALLQVELLFRQAFPASTRRYLPFSLASFTIKA